MKFVTLGMLLFWLESGSTAIAQAWKGEPNPDLARMTSQAKAGDPGAMADYAFHSMRCVGDVPYDQKKIFAYFTKSAAAGEVEGIVGLAHCYTFSVGTTRDLQKSYKLIQQPFAERHPVALKVMAYHNLGVDEILPRDEAKHYSLNEEAAEKGCVAASFNLSVADVAGVPKGKKFPQGMNRLRDLHERRVFPMATVRLLGFLRKEKIWDDDEELYRECYNMAHHYAELGEPEALYQLGRCHRRAGDEETAIGYFAQAATKGSRAAWYQLWLARQDRVTDARVWSSDQNRGNLAMRCYERGEVSSTVLTSASWEYLRRHKKPKNQAMFPKLEKDLRKSLYRGNCDAHDELGRLYDRANPKLNPDLARQDWAIAHLVAHSHHSPDAMGMLVFIYSGRDKGSEDDLAKAWTCAQKARKKGDDAWLREGNWKWIQEQLTPAIRKKSKVLDKDGYPSGEKHRRAAEDFLIALGHLPPREDPAEE